MRMNPGDQTAGRVRLTEKRKEEKIDNLDFIKSRNICASKYTINSEKAVDRMGENMSGEITCQVRD